MRKQLAITFLFLLFSIITFAQVNETSIDEKSGKKILTGICDRTGLSDESIGDWYLKEYESYVPDKKTIRKLKRKITVDTKITIVLAIWCGDSRRQVPRFLKILDLINYDDENLSMYCTDRNKNSKGIDTIELDIQRVPTFIVYHNKKESGRIIETPTISLEKDMLMIFRK